MSTAGTTHPVIQGIARSGSANLLAAAVGSVANLLIVVVVSRGGSTAQAGSFFAVTSVFLVTLSLVELGVDQGFVRFHARNIALGRPHANRTVLRSGLVPVLCLSSIAAGAGFLASGPLGRLVADAETEHAATAMMQVLALSLPVAAAYDLLIAKTRGHSVMKPTIFIERIGRPVLQIALLMLVMTFWPNPTLIAAAWIAPYLVGLLAVLACLARLPQATMPDTSNPSDAGIVSEFWRFTAPRGVARFFQVGLQRADIAIVAALAGPTAGALYTAATRFLVVGQVATQALQQVTEPHLARLIALNEWSTVRSVFHQLTLWSITLTWPLYLLVAVFAQPLLGWIFGDAYTAGSWSLTILAMAMLFSVAMGPVDVLLLMAGRSGLSLMNTGVALALDVIACLALVPLLGIEGAAIAWASAIVTRNILGLAQVGRHLRMTPLNSDTVASALICLALFGVAPGVAHVAGGLPAAIGISLTATLCYLIILRQKSGTLGLSGLLQRRHQVM